jgi:hypothetical protein
MYEYLGFTHEECIYNKVSEPRLMEFLAKYPIVSSKRDSNNYGEFRFITVKIERSLLCNDGSKIDSWVTFFGNGYHEYRGVNIRNNWEFFVGYNNYYGNKEFNYASTVQEIKQESKFMPLENESPDVLFATIADLADDDYAICELSDMEVI